MPFRDARMHFADILEGIALIESFLQGVDFQSYSSDIRTKSAVERQLQIITEAAYRLDNEAEVLCPGPNWKGFKAMGNVLRHGYHKVDDRIVWNTTQIDLPVLKEAVSRAMASLPEPK